LRGARRRNEITPEPAFERELDGGTVGTVDPPAPSAERPGVADPAVGGPAIDPLDPVGAFRDHDALDRIRGPVVRASPVAIHEEHDHLTPQRAFPDAGHIGVVQPAAGGGGSSRARGDQQEPGERAAHAE